MAEFLDRTKAVAAIKDLILHAEEKLIIFTYSLRISDDFRELLKYRNDKDKKTLIICGKKEVHQGELDFLKSLKNLTIKHSDHLHSKCYMTDKKIDWKLYDSANEEAQLIIDTCHDTELNLENEKGYCIRTGIPIRFNRYRPYNHEVYKKWASEGKKGSNPEMYCHFSGELSGGLTSYDKPVLFKNWNEATQKFKIDTSNSN